MLQADLFEVPQQNVDEINTHLAQPPAKENGTLVLSPHDFSSTAVSMLKNLLHLNLPPTAWWHFIVRASACGFCMLTVTGAANNTMECKAHNAQGVLSNVPNFSLRCTYCAWYDVFGECP